MDELEEVKWEAFPSRIQAGQTTVFSLLLLSLSSLFIAVASRGDGKIGL